MTRKEFDALIGAKGCNVKEIGRIGRLVRWITDYKGAPVDRLQIEFYPDRAGGLGWTYDIAARDFDGVKREIADRMQSHMALAGYEMARAFLNGHEV